MAQPTKHETDRYGICWKIRTIKGVDAWTLCGRASYESVTRCAEHQPRLAKRQKAAKSKPKAKVAKK